MTPTKALYRLTQRRERINCAYQRTAAVVKDSKDVRQLERIIRKRERLLHYAYQCYLRQFSGGG